MDATARATQGSSRLGLRALRARLLRAGGADVAKRVAALVKARHAAAHPDVGLPDVVRNAFMMRQWPGIL